MRGPAKPCVDNVRSADGGSNRIPLASAIRATISDTRTSPVLLVGISMARDSNETAETVPRQSVTHMQLVILWCIPKAV